MADDGSRPDRQSRRDAPSDVSEPLLSTAEAMPGEGADRSADESGTRSGDQSMEPTTGAPDGAGPGTGVFAGSSPELASSALWLSLLILGCFLAVFALGRAVGLHVSVLLDTALDTDTGQYLLLATVGGLLILMGQRELTSG